MVPLDNPAYSTPQYEGGLAMLGINAAVYEGAVDLALKDASGDVIGRGTGIYRNQPRYSCVCPSIHIRVE